MHFSGVSTDIGDVVGVESEVHEVSELEKDEGHEESPDCELLHQGEVEVNLHLYRLDVEELVLVSLGESSEVGLEVLVRIVVHKRHVDVLAVYALVDAVFVKDFRDKFLLVEPQLLRNLDVVAAFFETALGNGLDLGIL